MLNNEFPPLGGGQGVFNELLLSVIAANYSAIEVDLITASRASSGYHKEPFSRQISIYRVPVNNLDLHHARGVELIRYAARAMRVAGRLAKEKHYDLCMAYSAVPAGVVALYLKKLFGVRYITRSPGVDIPGFEKRYRFLYPVLNPIIRAVWRGASRNLVSSQQHAELMLSADPRSNPLVIPNGVDLELFHPSPERPTVRENKVPVVLCVARLVKRKGIDLLLHAFAKLKANRIEAQLLIVGTGDDRENLCRQARALGLGTTVEFRGAVARDEMPALYRHADIFVLPSNNEGMSNAALEAMASGLPLVLTNVGGAGELVTNGENGFVVDVGDVSALGDAIETLITDVEKWAQMSKASRKHSSRYGAEAMVNRYMQVMRSALQ